MSNDFQINESINDLTTLDQFINTIRVISHKKVIGPFDSLNINFGLYAGNTLEVFAFLYKDSQDKLKLIYGKECTKEDVKPDNPLFNYLVKAGSNDEKANLTAHSPDFKKYIVENGFRNYSIVNYENNSFEVLPEGLSMLTVDIPNFISNDLVLFLSEDKIIKGYSLTDRDPATGMSKEDFMVSHCWFPQSEGNISLATLLKVGNHYVGEDCLIYERKQKITESGKKIKEYIAPNKFNPFFKKSCS